MKKLLIFVLGLILLFVGCDSNKSSNMTNETKYPNFLSQRKEGVHGFSITANEQGIYFLKDSTISYYDFKSRQSVLLVSLGKIDGTNSSVSCQSDGSFTKSMECVYSDNSFFQVHGEFVYFITNYQNIEGENINSLARIKLDGSEYRKVLDLPSSVFDFYNMSIYNNHLFYFEKDDYIMKKVDLNTFKSSSVTDINNKLIEHFISFEFSNNQLLVHTHNAGKSNFYSFDSNLKLKPLFDLMEGGVFDGENNQYTVFETNSNQQLISKIVAEDGSLIMELKPQFKPSYLDDNLIYGVDYTSTRPNDFEILDYKGIVVYQIENKFSSPDILGVHQDELFVSDDQGNIYAVNFKTNQWVEIFR